MPAYDSHDETLPAHIEETVQHIAKLHEEHRRSASYVQLIAETFVRIVGRPAFAGVLLVLIASWTVVNTLASRAGAPAFDPPPFALLQDAVGVLALFRTVLILIAQRWEYKLEERRARLILQFALLAERKNAKII